MIQKTSVLTLLFLLLINISSCKKNVIKVNEDYVGYWTESVDTNSDRCLMTLNISSSGHAKYYTDTHMSDCTYVNKVSGKAKVNNEESRITISLHTYKIALKPTKIDTITFVRDPIKSAMKMEFDGKTLYKIIGR